MAVEATIYWQPILPAGTYWREFTSWIFARITVDYGADYGDADYGDRLPSDYGHSALIAPP